MNIDYEAIAREVAANLDGKGASQPGYVKAIIEAYEAQKAGPEWVPLDLATVKQGQEVRYSGWPASDPAEKFVCIYKGRLAVEAPEEDGLYLRGEEGGWLMRAQKPKTVRVRVFKHHSGRGYWAAAVTGQLNSDGQSHVGEGDIEVRE